MLNLETAETKKIAKGQMLLRQGDVTQYGYMVRRGCLKSYTVDDAGKQHIVIFAPENWLITDIDSFTNGVPSLVFIDAIENSEVVLITKDKFENLAALDKDMLVSLNEKCRNNLIATNKRIISLLSATAVERYTEFTETYPTLVQRLPLKLIASYIGVTPEYLSEIRRKIAQH